MPKMTPYRPIKTLKQRFTPFCYDAHGNVKWLANDLPGLGLRYTGYQYDLISGNVLGVDYNKGNVDQFFHKYAYDEDNRLLEVKTSRDGRLWDTDAAYSYYDHGPLARVELGEDKVQGVDYTYTIHGWLKAVNHPNLESVYDPGRDGMGSSSVGKDAFGMALGYYEGDFSSGGIAFNQNDPSKLAGLDLYNGNISSWTSGITPLNQGNQYEGLTGHMYQYDGLNRIKEADFQYFEGNWQNTVNFDANYSYDPNGNISSLTRYAYDNGNGNTMDGLTYFYQDGNNRLDFVDDQAGYWGADDIDSQNEQNYKYDAIGNLVYDDFGEKIINIDWTVYGKVHRIKQWEDNIITTFTYDAAGNRIKKKATNGGNTTTTFYSRDASGNVLAVYEKINNGPINLIEQPIYGSDRLGERKEVVDISGDLVVSEVVNRRLGLKQYELKNHLGSVSAIVSDYNLAEVDGDDLVNPKADLVAYNNFYSFGMMQPGRHAFSDNSRIGFQGQEKDNEIYGEGNLLSFKYRMHDPRIGRFFSVDPLTKSYPWNSPYAFAENSPIAFIDLEGLERYYAADGSLLGKIGDNNQIRVLPSKEIWDKANNGYYHPSVSKEVGRYHYLYKSSVPYHAAESHVQSNISKNIKENNIKSPHKVKAMGVDLRDSGEGANTPHIGQFNVFPNLTQDGEYINDYFYNQVNIWYHEEQHSLEWEKGTPNGGGRNPFIHFDIGYKQLLHSSYSYTTENFKSYINGVMSDYLNGQETILIRMIFSGNNAEKTKEFKYLYNKYLKNIKKFNEKFNKEYKPYDFKSFIKEANKVKKKSDG